ncbi:Ferredoxin--NAD(P)(+) reductase fdr [Arthrobacter sp. 9AX]|uniref:NAD(P)/FAD-dependent oxidoreductase n=1 Tax=Arthrobacter sp. 9AX TaxID=2653131 RepID=UPI0012F4701D|nr:FAD-dependent oxidoreductase [Arthrobacter sp. 9AX]VXC12951.1 Ferredoxin--NAD(P)(+) reductase fdr [Arthrobacter sp. 9AX]
MTEQHPVHPVIIVGAGHAGVAVAAGLRVRGWTGAITMFDEEHAVPYERPPLSKELLKPGAPEQTTLLRKETYYQDKDIHRVAGVGVTAIEPAARTVQLSDGTLQPYHQLVLATGSRARDLPVPGAGLPGVQALRSRDDALNLKRALVPGAKVVIIGAGYIGLEVAAAAVGLGCSVTVLEFQDRVMSRVTSEPVSRHFEELHRTQGVRFVFGAAVTGVEGTMKAERVRTADGSTYDADVVVTGIGVLPNQELAERAGLDCADGILVDGSGRTSDPHIFAAGDVTRFTSPIDGFSQRLECIQNAMAQAEGVADALTGTPAGTKTEVPWFWTVQHGVRLQTAGVRRPDDDVIVRGTPADGKFSVAYLRDGRLAAVDTVAGLSDFRPAKKLILDSARLDAELVANPHIGLADAVVPSTPVPVH